MTQNNEEIIDHGKANDLSKNNLFNGETILNILLLILMINQFNKKSPFPSGYEIIPEDDDYIVTMGKNPAFPLEKDEGQKPILNLESQEDLFSMINSLKPHMSPNNRRIINVFEKFQVLMEDINGLSKSFNDETDVQDISINQSKNIVKFMYDIKPFIHPQYHYQIQEFTDGINSVLDIQKNILNLQNSLSHINSSDDNSEKVNVLIDALQPFMDENQKKTISQLKNISQVLDMVKMAEDMTSKENNQESKTADEAKDKDSKSSQLMEILDIFNGSHKNVEKEHSESQDKYIDKNLETPIIQEQEHEEIFEEQEYEEIFEESFDNEGQVEVPPPELELKKEAPEKPELEDLED